MNLRWPAASGNGMRPWYGIAWAVLWLPVVFAGRFLFAVGIGVGQLSVSLGVDAWRETK